MTPSHPPSDSLQDVVTDILTSITGVDSLREAPDLKIRELGLLDSLGVISLNLALCEKFDLEIAPAEIEEEDVATPLAVCAFVTRKLNARTA